MTLLPHPPECWDYRHDISYTAPKHTIRMKFYTGWYRIVLRMEALEPGLGLISATYCVCDSLM